MTKVAAFILMIVTGTWSVRATPQVAAPPQAGAPVPANQGQAGEAAAPVQPTRFVGTWVGTQSWAVADAPPGSRQDQPVTLTLEVVNEKLVGSMKPFLGGEDGAIVEEATIVGDELRLKASVGRRNAPKPGTAQVEGRRGAPVEGWKTPVSVSFVFRNTAVDLTGTGDVPWAKFTYSLSKKRSRY